MKKCPNCKHKLYGTKEDGQYCKNCPYKNVPDHIRKCLNRHL